MPKMLPPFTPSNMIQPQPRVTVNGHPVVLAKQITITSKPFERDTIEIEIANAGEAIRALGGMTATEAAKEASLQVGKQVAALVESFRAIAEDMEDRPDVQVKHADAARRIRAAIGDPVFRLPKEMGALFTAKSKFSHTAYKFETIQTARGPLYLRRAVGSPDRTPYALRGADVMRDYFGHEHREEGQAA